jgi:hypothetical protein
MTIERLVTGVVAELRDQTAIEDRISLPHGVSVHRSLIADPEIHDTKSDGH